MITPRLFPEKYIYTVQVKAIVERQIEVESDHELTVGEISEKAQLIFRRTIYGGCDRVETGAIELAQIKPSDLVKGEYK
jgi:hypothetical protein